MFGNIKRLLVTMSFSFDHSSVASDFCNESDGLIVSIFRGGGYCVVIRLNTCRTNFIIDNISLAMFLSL